MQPNKRNAEFSFTDEDFIFISAMVKDKMGIVLKEHKKDMVYGRLARRLRALDLTEVSQYIAYIQSEEGYAEVDDFINALTTNLTHFFREEHHFEHLSTLLNTLSKTHKKGRYRMWSAGCSCGMEAYSIAMTAMEAMGGDINQWDFKILASDIDTDMLKIGENGLYVPKDIKNIPELLRKKYVHRKLIQGEEKFQIVDSLKKLVSFKQLNLLEQWPMRGKFDAIFCCNVVIYFDKETQTRLFNRMADYMVDDGWLFIGHSENISRITDRFELVGSNIYRKVAK